MTANGDESQPRPITEGYDDADDDGTNNDQEGVVPHFASVSAANMVEEGVKETVSANVK